MSRNELKQHYKVASIYNQLVFNPLSSALLNAALNTLTSNVQSFTFVATTGRSGTNTLNKIFECVDSVASYHEPYPKFHNVYPQGGEPYFRELFNRKKRQMIKKHCMGKRYYFESNNLFIKRFSDYAIAEFGEKVRVINLVREPFKVAKSHLEIDSVPGHQGDAQLFLLDPFDADNIVDFKSIAKPSSSLEYDYYKCLWYWYEVQARYEMFKRKYPEIKQYKMFTRDLNEYDKVKALMDHLDIVVNEQKLNNVIGIRENLKLQRKKERISNEDSVSLHESFKELLFANQHFDFTFDY